MPLQNALFLFITDIYIRGWTLINFPSLLRFIDGAENNGGNI
jgi:hypothetical protein